MKLKTMLMITTVALGAISSYSMPSDAEIAKTEPLVKELVADEFAAMKDGKKTRPEVAEACLGYIGDAETEAAKVVLIKMAFDQYMSGGVFDKAAETFGMLSESVKDVPDGLLGKWTQPYLAKVCKAGRADGVAILLNRAIADSDLDSANAIAKQVGSFRSRLSKSKAWPQLQTAMNEIIQLKARGKELSAIKAKLKVNPNDPELHEKLAVALAGSGDWKAALKEFAQASGKVAEIAVWENKYPETGMSEFTTATVADFWWNYTNEEKVPEATVRSFRKHAAGWFQIAIDNGALKGLKKTLAEKRIKEAEGYGEIEAVGEAATAAAPVGAGKPIKFKMGKGVEMELMFCPAGKFEMGYPYGGEHNKPHQVTITRPFWTAKFLITREQWETLMPPQRMNEVDLALGGLKAPISNISPQEIESFCLAMTKRYSRNLPKGYIFRMPTEAEWEYACRAGAKGDDPYGMPRGLNQQQGAAVAVRDFMKVEFLKKKGVDFDEKATWNLPGMTCGTKKPNRWGLFDMLGNIGELSYDRIPSVLPDGYKQRPGGNPEGVKYEDAKDPLFWSPEDAPVSMVRENRGSGDGFGGVKRNLMWTQRVRCVGFRIVAGPDLVKEKKLKRK